MERTIENLFFEISGESRKEIIEKNTAPFLLDIPECVLSITDGVIGLNRVFEKGYDVEIVDDSEMRTILLEIVKERCN